MKNQKCTWAALAVGTLAALGSATTVTAQSADTLIDVLVDKGVLTLDEAKQLREDADKDFTRAYASKSGMPDWVTALKLGGDFRGRFEGFYGDNPNFIQRERFRYRLRFGVTALMLEHFEVGFRLGSGNIDSGLTSGSDPISNNQDLGNNASKKGVFIDLAYATWHALNSPFMSADVTIGKMANPFVFSSLVLDHDYTPEGGAAQFTFHLNHDPARAQALKLNAGAFVLDENSSGNDPYLLGTQLRWDGKFGQEGKTTGFNATAGLAFLSIQNARALTTTSVPNIGRGNTRNAAGAPTANFNPLVADAALTYTLENFWMYNAPFPITLGGDYIYNPAVSSRNDGFSVGITFGKASKARLWQVSYTYRSLDANAWFEEFPDSDFGAYYASVPTGAGGNPGYSSGTNLRGHVAQIQYSPANALTLGMSAYIAELIDRPPAADNTSDMLRLHVEAMWKF